MELTLYQISDEQRRINAMLEETGGELTPEIEEALAINEGNFVTKAENYGKAILYYDAIVEAVKVEKKRLDGIQKTAENSMKRLKERLIDAMKTFDKPKVELSTMNLSLRKSEKVVIDDEKKIPKDCIKVTVEVSKTALKAYIKEGKECGAHLEENQSLQIK